MISLMFLAFPVLLIAGLSDIQGGISDMAESALALGLAASALTAALVTTTVLAWRGARWGRLGRAHHLAVVVAAVSFVWFLNNWNLLGLHV